MITGLAWPQQPVPQVARLPDFPQSQGLLAGAAPVSADGSFSCLAWASGCLCGWLVMKLDCALLWPARPFVGLPEQIALQVMSSNHGRLRQTGSYRGCCTAACSHPNVWLLRATAVPVSGCCLLSSALLCRLPMSCDST